MTELIGNTPLLRLNKIEKYFNLNCKLLAKCEKFNPAGSAKDRIALQMINDAEVNGTLKSGAVIIEPTSGNTGIGLAAVALYKGYKVILTMPESMSIERRNLLKAYGAELVLTPASDGMGGAVKKAEELQKEIPDSIIAGQFINPSNPKAHYLTTGPEIWNAVDGEVDIFIAGIGTGGTVSGVGKYLKEQNADIKIYGIEPDSSPVITKGFAGNHAIQGLGANFIPNTLSREYIDEIITITNEEAYTFGKLIVTQEAMMVGISSGAALCGSVKLAKLPENFGKTIVTLFPDTGERYLSTTMFD